MTATNQSADDLLQVYQQAVLEHSRNPHHLGRVSHATHEAEGFNPLCGDKVAVSLKLSGETIEAAAHETTGCAICMASASMMADAVTGKTTAESLQLIEAVNGMLLPENETNLPGMPLDALEGVRKYPSRIKCATLPWRSLEAALAGDAASVTTE